MIAQAQPLEMNDMLAAYASAQQRLLIFDYDGTLTPIVQNPAAAIISPEALTAIQKLAAESRNKVWIVSGRDQSFLEEVFNPPTQFGLIAEHGAFVRAPGFSFWQDLDAQLDTSWQENVINIFQAYAELTPGSYIEKKRKAVVWHFRQADQWYATFQVAACKKELEDGVGERSPFEFVNGKCVLEARCKCINKGSIVVRLVKKSWTKCPDFVLCCGDDVTDEDMFRALQDVVLPDDTRAYTVTIGDSLKITNAEWFLPDPREVLATIMTLNNSDQYSENEDEQGGSSKRNSSVLPIPRSYLVESGSQFFSEDVSMLTHQRQKSGSEESAVFKKSE